MPPSLLWAVLTFSANPLQSAPSDSVPVDIISTTEFTQMTQGSKTAKRQETPKPLVDKQGEKKPAPDPVQKVTEKKEVEATKHEPTPPTEQPEEQARAEAGTAKASAQGGSQARAEKPEPKTDPIAEALKKDDSKKKDEPEAGRSQAGADATEEGGAAEAAAEIRSVEDFRAARQARSAASGRDRRDHQPHGLARRADRQRRDPVAERHRCLARADSGLLESATRCAGSAELIVDVRLQLNRDGSVSAEPQVMRIAAVIRNSRWRPKPPAAPLSAARHTKCRSRNMTSGRMSK